MRSIFAVAVLAFLSAVPAIAADTLPNGFNTANPTQYGFVLVFDDEFASSSTIDLTNSLAPGFNWYLKKFNGTTTGAGEISVSGGTLTITMATAGEIYTLATAAPTSSTTFVGTAFGHSSPGTPRAFYFEANLAFDNTLVNIADRWPAFWALALEPEISGTNYAQWPGQTTGYTDHIEDDFFEFNQNNALKYGATLHNWYGIYNVTCGTYCVTTNTSNDVVTLGSVTWTSFNKVGQLWVLGSAANNYNGYIVNYFNGVPVSKVAWVGPGGTGVFASPTVANPPVPPPAYPFNFSILDSQNLILAIGTGTNSVPMQFKYVRVYQLN